MSSRLDLASLRSVMIRLFFGNGAVVMEPIRDLYEARMGFCRTRRIENNAVHQAIAQTRQIGLERISSQRNLRSHAIARLAALTGTQCIRHRVNRSSFFQSRDGGYRNRPDAARPATLPNVRTIDQIARMERFATQRADTPLAGGAHDPGLLAVPP